MSLVSNNNRRRAAESVTAGAVAALSNPIVRNVIGQVANEAASGFARRVGQGASNFVNVSKRQLKRLRRAANTPQGVQQSVPVVPVIVPQPPKRRNRVPKARDERGPITTITRSELVQAIVAPDAGSTVVRSWVLSPNRPAFPWLSTVCQGWSQFKFTNIRFSFKPVIGAYSSTGAIGSMTLGFDPDPNADDVLSQTAVMNLQYHSEFRLDQRGSVACNAGRLLDWYDINDVANQDDWSDLGKLYIAISGSPLVVGTTLGYLRVDYTVQLCLPRLTAYGSIGKFGQVYTSSQSAGVTNKLGTAWYFAPGNTLRVTYYGSGQNDWDVRVNGTNNTIDFQYPGKYLLVFTWGSSDTAITVAPSLGWTFNTASIASIGFLGQVFYDTLGAQMITGVDVLQSNGYVTVGGLTGLAAATLTMYFVAIPPDFLAQPTLTNEERKTLDAVLRKFTPAIKAPAPEKQKGKGPDEASSSVSVVLPPSDIELVRASSTTSSEEELEHSP